MDVGAEGLGTQLDVQLDSTRALVPWLEPKPSTASESCWAKNRAPGGCGRPGSGCREHRAAAVKPWRTPWGDHDLRGSWSNATTTPLKRPAKYAGREFLTPKERASQDKDTEIGRDKRADLGTAQEVAGAYNAFWWEWGSSDGRTSVIYDPPDGRIWTRVFASGWGIRAAIGRAIRCWSKSPISTTEPALKDLPRTCSWSKGGPAYPTSRSITGSPSTIPPPGLVRGLRRLIGIRRHPVRIGVSRGQHRPLRHPVGGARRRAERHGQSSPTGKVDTPGRGRAGAPRFGHPVAASTGVEFGTCRVDVLAIERPVLTQPAFASISNREDPNPN
jgi:hypothetical protein